METSGETAAKAAGSRAEPIEDRARAVGERLGRSIAAVLGSLPGAPLRPNDVVRTLGVNRAVASKVLNASGKRNGLEVLHLIPGPEPLRKLVRAAGERVPDELVEEAEQAIAEFDLLIRHEAGTRAALDALISTNLPDARERFELASKYSVHKGMSQLKGVRGELWLGLAVVAPNADDSLRLDLTWLNAAVAMQRLRPGVVARFSYRHRRSDAPQDEPLEGPEAALGVVPLEEFCLNPPARLEARQEGDTIHYTLPDDLLGPNAVVDMFVVDHHPAALKRYSTSQSRKQTSFFLEPAIPVSTLVFDVLLHEEAFPGSEPELVMYDTGYLGIADVNDPERDIDRMDLQESVEFLGRGLSRFHMTELPSYGPMLAHLSEHFGWDPGRFRGYRARVRYPVYGWQICLAFEPPAG